jgi:hypothetical protein
MNAGPQSRPQTAATTAIQQGIGTLNEHYRNNEIDLQELLDGLLTVVVKQHKLTLTLIMHYDYHSAFFSIFFYNINCVLCLLYINKVISI